MSEHINIVSLLMPVCLSCNKNMSIKDNDFHEFREVFVGKCLYCDEVTMVFEGDPQDWK